MLISPCKKPSVLLLLFLIIIIFSCPNFALSQYQEELPTSLTIMLVCGDGVAEIAGGEICDPGDPPMIPDDVGSSTCQMFDDIFGNPFNSGTLGCNAVCTDFDTSQCYTCGNGNKEERELCDGSDFGGQTCVSMGFESGTLLCTGTCRLNTSNCVAKENEGGVPGGGAGGGGAGSPTGFQPGTDESQDTKVIIRGKSYPSSDVHVLVDGKVVGIVKADNKADFYFETSQITPGIASFGFWSEDKLGLKSTLLTLTFRVTSRAVTTISGIYIAPTIEVDKKSVKQGESVKIYGQTVPDTEVMIHINSPQEFVEKTSSVKTGDWNINFNTAPLNEEFHTAKAYFQVNASGNIIKSGFSKSVSFHVGKLGGTPLCPNADLNKDSRVNLTDFSILLYYWGTDNACADQNQNGKVELVDFSIMMYYWTG